MKTMQKTSIGNCDFIFEKMSPEDWTKFDKTDNPHIRSCQVCKKNVYSVYNFDEFIKYAKEGKCVATFEYDKVRKPTYLGFPDDLILDILEDKTKS